MEYTQLSNTGIQVSKICLGTMTFGEQNSEAEAHEQLDYALENGVNFIDTAELYAVPSTEANNGLTEQYIGSWLANRKCRDKVIIGTKVAGPSKGLKYISSNLGFSRNRIKEAVDGSLKRLQTDYIDLYQLHWPDRPMNMFGQRGYQHPKTDEWQNTFLQTMQILNEVKRSGKIRHYGLSNESAWGAMKYLQTADLNSLDRMVSIQNPYSLLNRTYEVGLAEVSIRENIGLLAYSPMAFGLLSGKYHKGEDTANHRLNKFKQMQRYNSDNCFEATKQYLTIAEKNEMTLAQMALAYVNTRPFLTSNIIGATNLKQLKENIDSIHIQLNDEVLSEIEQVHHKIPNPAP